MTWSSKQWCLTIYKHTDRW